MRSKIAIAFAMLAVAFAIVVACATAGTPETCTGGTTSCDNACVNLVNDNANCGACAAACTNGQVCSSGKCSSSCGANETLCSGVCVTTGNDDQNCGKCGNKCGSGQTCVSGTCSGGSGGDAGDSGVTCTQGKTACNTDAGVTCVNTQTDNDNCGSCNAPCTADQSCVAGKCTLDCDAGTTLCVDASVQYCANFTDDNNNCGACNDYCDGGTCQSSVCVANTLTAVEIFPPTGTNEDPGNASVWGGRYYTVTFAQSQTIEGIEWRANLAALDTIHAEIWSSAQVQLAVGSNVNGSGTEAFYKAPINYTVAANTAYLIGVFMSNVNTVFPRKDTPSYPFSVTGPHGNISVTACWSTSGTTDIFPTSTNVWGPDFKFDIL